MEVAVAEFSFGRKELPVLGSVLRDQSVGGFIFRP